MSCNCFYTLPLACEWICKLLRNEFEDSTYIIRFTDIPCRPKEPCICVRSSGMWYRVIGRMVPYFSRQRIGLIFEDRTVQGRIILETSDTNYPVTRCQVLEETRPHPYGRESLKFGCVRIYIYIYIYIYVCVCVCVFIQYSTVKVTQ